MCPTQVNYQVMSRRSRSHTYLPLKPSSRMTLLYSHGRHLPAPCYFLKVKIHTSTSRMSSCRYVRRRYATIAVDDFTPHKPPPPPLKNPFPYPNNAKPTPHQIFHLPFNATQAQIKARCKSDLRKFSNIGFPTT